ncbi:MAG: DNA translocase FtsK [Thermoleophilia bacterium]
MSTQVARRRNTRRPAPRKRGTPAMSPHQVRELVGMGLAGLGLFLAAQLYLGFGAGPLGGWLEDLVRLGVGRLTVAAPLALVGLGVLLILDDDLLRIAPLRLGAGIGLVSVCTALAAGSFGLGGMTRDGWFSARVMQARGGSVGEAVYFVTGNSVGSIGTGILVGLGIIASAVLISGASLGHVLRRSGKGAATASRSVGRGMASATLTALRGGQAFSRQVRSAVDTGSGVAVVGIRRRRAPDPAPLVDGADSFPDLFDEPSHLPPSPALADELGRVDGDDAPAPASARADAPLTYEDAVLEQPVLDEGTEEELPPPPPDLDAPVEDDDEVPGEPEAAPVVRRRVSVGEDGRPNYRRPSLRLLRRTGGPNRVPQALISETSRRLEETLGHFGITATVSDAVSGPRVTRYELQLAPGTKVGRVTALRDDLAYALAARDELRIIAPIPGKQAVGVEVPNPEAQLITLGDIYREFPEGSGPLMAWLGLDISGKPVYVDLAKMPHLLIAGSTGTGKSVCLNVLLASLLLRSSPNELRMILIDPKKVELNHYESIPHLLTPVVTNMRDASAVLTNIVREMETRYELMGLARARNLRDWNEARAKAGQPPMPTVLVLIDELADLMMVSPAEVEDAIIRLAQKSRAVGIHLVLATQRPSADVITGMIKANVPSRVAFAVSSQVDSRVILDAGGAESLLGSGDMLFRPVGTSRLQRLQGAYVSEEEIQAITDHWRAQGRPEMRQELLERPPEAAVEEPDPESDEMLAKAIELVVQQGTASVSLLQRRLGVGYARAGRLVDMMERMNVVSGHEGSKPRTVLVGEGDLPRLLSRAGAAGSDPEMDTPPD